MNGGKTLSSTSLVARRNATPSSTTSASTPAGFHAVRKRSPPRASNASSNAKENASTREVPPGPSKTLQKKTRKPDRLHMVQRLSSKSLKRYQRYYKLKPKHTHTVLPEIAKHFDGLHVDEKDVVARFLQTLKQAEREKRRK